MLSPNCVSPHVPLVTSVPIEENIFVYELAAFMAKLTEMEQHKTTISDASCAFQG